MAKVWHTQSRQDGESVAAGLTRYISPYASIETDSTALGVKLYQAETWNNLSFLVTANTLSGNMTLTLLKNGSATSLKVTVTSGQTGIISDTSNSASFSADDLALWEVVTASGTGSATLVAIGAVRDGSSAITIFGANGASSTNLNSASTTYYMSPHGARDGNTAETNITRRTPLTATLRKFQVVTGTVTRSTNTVMTTRVNSGAGSSTVTITPSSGSSSLVDDSNTDSVTAGNEISYTGLTGTGTGNCNIEKIGCQLVTNDGKFSVNLGTGTGTGNIGTSVTGYYPPGGEWFSTNVPTTESNVQITTYLAHNVTQLYCRVRSNAITASSTMNLRVNGSTVGTLTIPASTTGEITASVNINISSGDEVNWQLVTGSTGSNIRIYEVGYVATEIAGGGGLSIPIAAYHYNHHFR